LKKNENLSLPRQIPLGRLVNTHGLGGEMRLLPYSFPCPTLRKGISVSLQGQNSLACRYTIESVRPHASFLLLKLQGVDSREQAYALRGSVVLVEETLLPPLQEGEFYYYQIKGVRVLTTSGECIGTIADVFFSGGHDIWIVRQDQKEYMIPVIDEVVRSLDIQGRQAIIEPLPGLLE
jgi:16S rRNA processing protein RimM